MKIKILSKNLFELSVVPLVESDWMDNKFIISILDPDNPNSFFKDSNNYKTFWFYDLEEEIGNYKPMTPEQANELVDFILSNKDKEVCIVHCSAGVSRSGAVGEFINDLFGEDYQTFKKNNPYIVPNIHIKKLLNKALEQLQ